MNARGIAASLCAALLLCMSAFAEPKKQKEKEEDEESSSPYDAATRSKSGDAITNEDLERMMEEKPDVQLRELPPTPPPAPKAAPAKPKPKAKAQPVSQPRPQPRTQSKAQRSSVPFVVIPKAPHATAAGSKVAALESRVAELEKAILAAKNPALPREWMKPKGVPPGSLKDRETQLRQSREELAAARQELARRRSSGP